MAITRRRQALSLAAQASLLITMSARAQTFTEVVPRDVAADGSTAVRLLGSGFDADTAALIDGKPLLEFRLDARDPSHIIHGKAPPLDRGEAPGLKDAAVIFRTGIAPVRVDLRNGVNYYLAVRIDSFSPAEASYLGKTPFEIGREGFTPDTVATIDSVRVVPGSVLPTSLKGLLPPLQGKVRLMARGSPKNKLENPNDASWGPWSPVRVYDASKQPQDGSNAINVYKKPAYMDAPGAYVTGSYTPEALTYNFNVEMAPPGAGGKDFGESQSFPLEILGLGIPFPALTNDIRCGNQTISLSFSKGLWTVRSHKGDLVALNGTVSGARELLAGGGGGGTGSGGLFDLNPNYDYCERQVLFSESYNTTLFDALLYSRFVGPVQVNVSASVSLGVSLSLETQIEVHLRALDPANPFEAHFWLLPQATIGLGAAVRADIFFGVASVEAGLDLEPVRIHVEVDSVPGEMNPADNLRDCPFGPQPPRDLSCRLQAAGEENAVVLRWTNGSLYDQVLVYRDEMLAAQLPGGTTLWVDTGAGFLHQDGLGAHHDYAVRGRLGDS